MHVYLVLGVLSVHVYLVLSVLSVHVYLVQSVLSVHTYLVLSVLSVHLLSVHVFEYLEQAVPIFSTLQANFQSPEVHT